MNRAVELAPGWTLVPLGEVADATLGKTPRRADYRDSGKYRILKYRDLKSGRVDSSETKDAYVVDDPVALKGLRRLQPGDVLIGASGHDGSTVGRKLALVEQLPGPEAEPVFFVGELFRIRPLSTETDSRWFLHYFSSEDGYRALQRAVTGGHLTNGRARQIAVPMAPPEVQKRLSDLLDRIRGRATSSSRHLDAAGRAINRFRHAVLAAACSGRLTAEWREANSGGPSALDLIRGIAAARGPRSGHRHAAPAEAAGEDEFPDSWCWASIGALVDVATGATPLRKRADYYGGGIPWVTSGAVNAGLITEPTEWITDLALEETNAKLFPAGTLLLAMYGEGQTRGRVAELGIRAATNQAVAALLFDEATQFLRPYLKLFLLENYERIRALAFGGVQPNLSLGVIRETLLPLPPASEQTEIVERVAQLLALADSLRVRVDRASQQVTRSSQAILAKAFRGGLLPIDTAAAIADGTPSVVRAR